MMFGSWVTFPAHGSVDPRLQNINHKSVFRLLIVLMLLVVHPPARRGTGVRAQIAGNGFLWSLSLGSQVRDFCSLATEGSTGDLSCCALLAFLLLDDFCTCL